MDKLAELQRKRAGLVARMREIVKQEDDMGEGENLPDNLQDEFNALQSELAALQGRLDRLASMLAADANAANENGDGDSGGEASFAAVTRTPAAEILDPISTAGPLVKTGGGLRVWARPKGRTFTEGKGYQAARFCIGLLHKKWNGTDKACEFIVNRFGDTDVAKALNTLVVAEGGALIPQDFMADLIELLRANTVVRGASPMTVGMPMGNLTIPRLAGGASAGYQGELDDIALTEEAFDDVNFVAKKLTAMVPVSNDLIRRAPIGIEEIVRDDLVQTIARREDLAFLRGDGTGKSPIGFRSLVLPANLIAIPAGANLDAVVAGLSALMLTLVNGMSRMLRPHWFMAPSVIRFIAVQRDQVGGFYYKDEIARGTLEGIPWSYTQQIPTNLGAGNGSEIYLVDMADAIIADTLNVQVDASDVAAYYGTDGQVVSAFQRDQSVFRIISEHDFNMRHLQSLAIGQTSDWNFTAVPGSPGAPWSTQPLNPHWAQAPAAWPANATTHDPAPTIYDPATAKTSAFDGLLTDQPGGLPPGTLSSEGTITAPGAQQAPPPPVHGQGQASPPAENGNGDRGGRRSR